LLFQWLGRFLLLGAFLAFASGQAALELVDGRIISGTDVRREGAVYVLTLEGGDTVTLPLELVAQVRLFGTGETRAPSGIRDEGSKTLAGGEVDVPTTSEQLEVFGEPSRFQKSNVNHDWVPESAWDEDEDVLEASRSTWQESPIDPEWKPESAWDKDEDVLEASRSTWQKSSINSEWKPTDGFKDSVGQRKHFD
jgi:hypothetical protein